MRPYRCEQAGRALAERLFGAHRAGHQPHQRYSTDLDLVAFLENEEKQDAIIRNLEILGEAAGNIRHHFPEFVTRHPDFPLRAAYETRNSLAHGYFQVDLDIVWRTVQRDLPLLQEQVRNVLDALRSRSSG